MAADVAARGHVRGLVGRAPAGAVAAEGTA